MFRYLRILALKLCSHVLHTGVSYIHDFFKNITTSASLCTAWCLCPQILWLVKKREMVLLVIQHVLSFMFLPHVKCHSLCLHKHFSTCGDINKHSIWSADALMLCVSQCCFFLCTGSQYIPPNPAHAFICNFIVIFVVNKFHPFLNLLTSIELLPNFCSSYCFGFLCCIYNLTLDSI